MPDPGRAELTEAFIERFKSLSFPEQARLLAEEARKNLQAHADRAAEAERAKREAIERRARRMGNWATTGVHVVFLVIAWANWEIVDAAVGHDLGAGLLVAIAIPMMFGAHSVGWRVEPAAYKKYVHAEGCPEIDEE